MTKCPQCGHDADMHWYPGCPGAFGVMGYEDQEYNTSACRDCLPRHMYAHDLEDGPHKGLVHKGMCTWTKDCIEASNE